MTLWHKKVQLHLPENNESSGVFEDENGVLRYKGQIKKSTLPYSTKFPKVLPRKHRFTELVPVIFHSHGTVKHNGIRETLTEVRSNYWIVKGRQVVKGLLPRCVVCKKLSGKPYEKQPTPPLPDFKVADDPVFSRIGIDFADPLYVKDIYRRAEVSKCYIAVFTCASSSSIRAFKRFIGRRGIPPVVVSDNGKTFHDARLKTLLHRKISPGNSMHLQLVG